MNKPPALLRSFTDHTDASAETDAEVGLRHNMHRSISSGNATPTRSLSTSLPVSSTLKMRGTSSSGTSFTRFLTRCHLSALPFALGVVLLLVLVIGYRISHMDTESAEVVPLSHVSRSSANKVSGVTFYDTPERSSSVHVCPQIAEHVAGAGIKSAMKSTRHWSMASWPAAILSDRNTQLIVYDVAINIREGELKIPLFHLRPKSGDDMENVLVHGHSVVALDNATFTANLLAAMSDRTLLCAVHYIDDAKSAEWTAVAPVTYYHLPQVSRQTPSIICPLQIMRIPDRFALYYNGAATYHNSRAPTLEDIATHNTRRRNKTSAANGAEQIFSLDLCVSHYKRVHTVLFHRALEETVLSVDDIVDWIEYHLVLGVDRFVIFDRTGTYTTKALLQPYIHSGLLTMELFPLCAGCQQQVSDEEDHLIQMYVNDVKARHYARWVLHADFNEYISLSHRSLLYAPRHDHNSLKSSTTLSRYLDGKKAFGQVRCYPISVPGNALIPKYQEIQPIDSYRYRAQRDTHMHTLSRSICRQWNSSSSHCYWAYAQRQVYRHLFSETTYWAPSIGQSLYQPHFVITLDTHVHISSRPTFDQAGIAHDEKSSHQLECLVYRYIHMNDETLRVHDALDAADFFAKYSVRDEIISQTFDQIRPVQIN